MVDAEFDCAAQNLDDVRGIAVLQLHCTEADTQNIVAAQFSVGARS